MRTKLISGAGTVTVDIRTLITDPKSRLLGILCICGAATGTDAAQFTLFVSSAGPTVDRAVGNGKAQTAQQTVSWWTGVDRQHKESLVGPTPSNDASAGFFPRATPLAWKDDGGVDLFLKLQTVIAGTGVIMLIYTCDPAVDTGEQI